MESWKTDLFKVSSTFSVGARERERERAMCLFLREGPSPEQISWRTSAYCHMETTWGQRGTCFRICMQYS